jgi:hypothetical protein
LQHERPPLPRRDLELRSGSRTGWLEPEQRAQGKRLSRRAKHDTRRLDGELRLIQPIVEARLDLETEAQSPTHPDHAPDQPLRAATHGHEILNLAHALRGEKPPDQDVGVGNVELLRRSARIHGRDPVKPAPRSRSSSAAKTLGPSNRSGENQSIVQSLPTSAAVRRLPIIPCSAMGR